jgi:formyl-CoA transferase
MQDSVLNLCRVKMRDQQRIKHGPLTEYPNKTFGNEVPRSGNASGGGQPGAAVQCKPGGPNDYCYVIIQPQIWEVLAKTIGRPELAQDPAFATPEARIKHLDEVFWIIEQWTMKNTKHEVMRTLMEADVPCGPVLSMMDLIEDESLTKRGIIADVLHPERGVFKTVGCPIVLSDSPIEIKTSPLLGEHSTEILKEVMGYDDQQLEQLHAEGVI